MSDDLVERVARAMMRFEPWSSFWSEADAEKLASTAVALALEEAAKVCDAIENRLTELWKANYKICDYTQGASDGANDCAAAIRALVKQSTTEEESA